MSVPDVLPPEFREFLAEFFFSKGVRLLAKGWSAFRSRVPMPGERNELLSELLFREGRHLFHAAREYKPQLEQTTPPQPTGRGYPHDVKALEAIERVVTGTIEYTDSPRSANVSPSDYLVTAGSPKANQIAGQYVPSLIIRKNGEHVERKVIGPAKRIPYTLVEDLSQPLVTVFSLARGGKKDDKTRKAIRHSTRGSPENWQPRGYSQSVMLEKDFLLVSRLPRNHDGGAILSVAGAHGPGTEATQLLVENIPFSQLKTLQKILGDKPYYQFVVEVTQLKHIEGVGSFASEAKICLEDDDLPPQTIEFK
jgi:hypothetical protein